VRVAFAHGHRRSRRASWVALDSARAFSARASSAARARRSAFAFSSPAVPFKRVFSPSRAAVRSARARAAAFGIR